MKQVRKGLTNGPEEAPAEQVLKDIRRQTRRQYSAEEKIRIVRGGLGQARKSRGGRNGSAAMCWPAGCAGLVKAVVMALIRQVLFQPDQSPRHLLASYAGDCASARSAHEPGPLRRQSGPAVQ
jgi:hypothetical protein